MLKTIRRVRSHFIAAANHARLIEREHLIINRDKVLPTLILDTLVIWPTPMASPLHARMYYLSQAAVQHRMEHMLMGDAKQYLALHNEVPEPLSKSVEGFFNHYAGHTEKVMKDNPKQAREIEETLKSMGMTIPEIRGDLEKGTFPHVCRPFGEWLHDYEHVMNDENLKRWGKISAYVGAGEEVLDFWRTINSLPDWKAHVRPINFDIDMRLPPRDPRKRKPRQMREAAPVWNPTPHAI